MKRIRFAHLGLGLLAALGMSSQAVAGGRNPGSLLLYPEFDNRYGIATVLTVTNTSQTDDINVHFIYVGRYGHENADLNCEEFDRDHDLTPNDTLTVITKNHNPQQEQGYVFAYARNEANQAVTFDYLIGNLLAVNGLEAFEYSVNPVAFNGVPSQGSLTDVDLDGIRDLDGIEYEFAPDEVQVPRFLGQGNRNDSELILIGLSGGAAYTTTANFLVYNDNEDQFSAQYTFRCWDKTPILDVSDVFENDWLIDNSGQNPAKKLGTDQEYGWFRITGGVASAGACSLIDATVYGVYIEVINSTAAADLPFEEGENDGHLLPRLLTGDNSEDGCPF
jgi:hypothetical protein